LSMGNIVESRWENSRIATPLKVKGKCFLNKIRIPPDKPRGNTKAFMIINKEKRGSHLLTQGVDVAVMLYKCKSEFHKA